MRSWGSIALIVACVGYPQSAAAEDPPEAPPTEEEPAEDLTVVKARDAFVRGNELVKEAKWSEALASFERARALRSHAVTSFNMGICLRALGRYVLASKSFREARALDDEANRAQLSDTLRADVDAMLQEIDKTLVRARITLTPLSATIAVDGRPLERLGEQGSKADMPTLLAGTRAAGRGERAPASRFDVLIDPGSHVITLARKGYRDAIVNRTFNPGARVKLDLRIERLPARVRIDATPKDAAVTVDGRDAGTAPLDIERRAGTYDVVVQKKGYVPYEQTVTLAPGQQVSIRARLPEEPPALHERWWFWTSLVGAAASIAVTTFVVVYRPPEPDPPDGGGLGWVIEPP
ncbi:MAG TPA: PEGA domain-containing protein [Polyangiaceae bacterium]|nr:PEGA domain-containing protein [Polyangiaceae bacterium]